LRTWKKVHLGALVLLIPALLIATACDDSEDSKPTQTPAASATLVATPEPAPTIAGNTIESQAKGYRATFPDGWNPRPNLTTAGGIRADAFFAPETVNEVQPNISVVCHPREVESTKEWAATRIETLRALERTNINALGAIQIAGMSGEQIVYTIERFGASVSIEEIVFVARDCDWIVTLTVPDGASSDYRQEFDRFVASFTFAEPVSDESI
jgi:hypothetical protein